MLGTVGKLSKTGSSQIESIPNSKGIQVLFSENVALTLKLTIDNTIVEIPGANIKSWSVSMRSWGFSAELSFWLDAKKNRDTLFAHFIKDKPIEVSLQIAKSYYETKPAPKPLQLEGWVTGRALWEQDAPGISGEPILFRKYTIEFSDIAAVLWPQHRPVEVLADTTLEKVIKANIPAGLKLKMNWNALKAKHGIVCLGLGGTEESFYDFIAWLAESWAGHFYYDYPTKTYQLASKKKKVSKKEEIGAADCDSLILHYPQRKRFSSAILNSHTLDTSTTKVEQELGLSSIRHDLMLHSPLSATAKNLKTIETKRLESRDYQLRISFACFPEMYLAPGEGYVLGRDDFSSNTKPFGKTFRGLSFDMSAQAIKAEAEDDLDLESTQYDMSYSAVLERDGDNCPNLPTYKTPRWPIEVEGKIVSAIGKDKDRTYTVYENAKTSQNFYKVNIPLWNVTIQTPFEPQFAPGHFYFPAYKDSRVLMDVGFDHAHITRFLDWGEGVKLPSDSQGNHILFGKNKTSETSMRHMYVDNKPEFQIYRVEDGDTEIMLLKDGTILLETKEDSSKESSTSGTDLTPQVEANKAQLESAAQSATGEVSSALTGSTGKLSSEVEGAVGNATASLESMDEELSAAVNDINLEVEEAVQGLAEQSNAVKTAVEDAKAQLKALTE